MAKIVNKRLKTEKAYLPSFQKYVNFTGMPPEELLAEAEAKNNKNKAMRKRAIVTRRTDSGFIWRMKLTYPQILS
ncbi:hypothetical protein ACSAZL_05585 [Methanosarcina sp. T3]|uniref:hypothetical protein n=1 Tax=Methanosarcina sp. T3 TaxID=3439062 RepID=UPI003F856518